MRVYFVRHGESEENVTGIFGGETSPLTQFGEEQAHFVAERFLNIPVDLILASDMERARHTAEIISRRVGQAVIHSELLRELRGPSDFLGRDPQDEETLAMRAKWLKGRFSDEHFRFSDEETFSEAKARAKEAFSYIASHDVNDILVVSHGTFLRVVLGVLILRDNFSPQMFKHLRELLVVSNTGITLFDVVDDTWKLITWNDHAHLGEVG